MIFAKKYQNAVRAVLLTVGLLMVILGIFFGETTAVMMKAVFICLECIGIG
ncbi:MAG: CD1871A family CXXC motif-containing protein [Anaerovoracaceae bacterium]|jgi:hypothetical protein